MSQPFRHAILTYSKSLFVKSYRYVFKILPLILTLCYKYVQPSNNVTNYTLISNVYISNLYPIELC